MSVKFGPDKPIDWNHRDRLALSFLRHMIEIEQ
jgi:hypothetical protein